VYIRNGVTIATHHCPLINSGGVNTIPEMEFIFSGSLSTTTALVVSLVACGVVVLLLALLTLALIATHQYLK
jgi:hypothetical protein